MKGDWGPLTAPFVGGLAIGASIVTFLLLIAPAFSVETYCVSGESPIACGREWAMTVGTWFAAIVGIGAAYFVYQTILRMNEQIQEARKQTRYIIGDEDPVLELLPNAAIESGKFRLTNWNREAFVVCEIRWRSELEVMGMDAIDRGDSESVEVDDDGILKRRIRVEGWVNRNEPPSVLEASYSYVSMDDFAESHIQETPAHLEIVGYLSGKNRRRRELVATAPMVETFLT